MVGIESERHLRPDRVPQGCNAPDVSLRVFASHLELDGAEAGGNRSPPSTLDLVDRLVNGVKG